MTFKTWFGEACASITHADAQARRTGLGALLLLAACCVGFSAAHLLQTRGFLDSEMWRISRDGGYAEWFEYLMLAASAAMFVLLYFRRREILFLTIASVLSYLFADNALELHEAAGRAYAASGSVINFDGVPPHHVGQLLYLCAAGALLLSAIAFAARKAGGEARIAGAIVAMLLICFGVFSAFIDTLSDWLAMSELAFLEDSGELFAIAAILAYSIFLAAANARRRMPEPA